MNEAAKSVSGSECKLTTVATGTVASVEIGEPGVGMGRRMHLGEIDAARHGKHRAEDILAADHHDLVDAGPFGRAPRLSKPLFQTVGHDCVRRDKAAVAGEHDVEAAIENARKRFEGAPAHDDGLAHGDLTEIAHVAGEPPGQVPAPADGAVLSHGHDQRDDGRAGRLPIRTHTATSALIAGCGS